MNNKICTLAFCSLLAFEWSAFGANVPVPKDTVADRVRPELEPPGMRVGAFMAFPQISVGIHHDDNVYADTRDEVSDNITVVSPRIELKSGWSRHSLNLTAEADIGRYSDNSSEDYEDVRLAANGRLAITNSSSLRLTGRLESLHDDRFSPDDRDGDAPTEFDRAVFATGYERKAGKLSLRLDAELKSSDYDDVAGLDGDINNDDRDRDETRLSFRVGHELGPSTEVFVRGGIASIDYDSSVDDDGFARSSSGSEIAVGAKLDVSALTSFEGFVGMARRNYDDPQLQDIDASWFGGKLIWRLSGLTTVTADATRRVEETTQRGASGYVATRIGAAVDHELLRNLILHLSVYQQDNDYEGIDRSDDIVGTSFSVNYTMNKYFTIDFGYDTRDRDIDDALAIEDGYNTGVISLRFTGRR